MTKMKKNKPQIALPRGFRRMLGRNALMISTVAFAMGMQGCTDEPQPIVNQAGRAVLVYMVADNSLGSAGYDSADLDEMVEAARAGDLGDNRLIVYHSSRTSAPVLQEVTPDGLVTMRQYDYTQSSITVEGMKRVIADFKSLAPAENYGLVLWSHASGWIQNGVVDNAVATMSVTDGMVEAYSFGDERGRHMNVTSLQHALEGEGFDYIYFDCCFMANVESLYQLRHVAPMFVASATELPANGMPYDENVKYLCSDTPDLVAAAKTTFDYYNALSGSNRTCTVSVIDSGGLDDLATKSGEMLARCDAPSDYTPQRFMTSGCYLFDMRDYFEAMGDGEQYAGILNDWKAAFNRTVVFSASTPMLWNYISLDKSHGLSCYILEEIGDASYRGYDTLDWWHDVGKRQFE